jgi:hypothetical protein
MGNATATTTAASPRDPEAPLLLEAVARRDMAAVAALLPASSAAAAACRELLKRALDRRGQAALHLACGSGSPLVIARDDSVSKVNLVGYLIARGASVSVRDASGWTPLHHACAAGDLLVVRLLLENSADPRARNHLGISSLDFLAREFLVPGRVPVPQFIEQELRLCTGEAARPSFREDATSKNADGKNADVATGCDLRVPEVVHCGDVLNVLLTKRSPAPAEPNNTKNNNNISADPDPSAAARLLMPTTYYAQMYYVDPQRPWVMRKRVGSYRYLTSATPHGGAAAAAAEVGVTQAGAESGNVLHFGTAQLAVGAKFRILLHTGRGGNLEVGCASNVVTILATKKTKNKNKNNINDDDDSNDVGDAGAVRVGASDGTSGGRVRTSSGTEIATETVAIPVEGDEFDVALEDGEEAGESLFGSSNHEVRSPEFYVAVSSLASTAEIWFDSLQHPPPEDFAFDLRVHTVDIELALEKYPQLMSLRFRLVPCWMEEVHFWRVYFYQIAVLRDRHRER